MSEKSDGLVEKIWGVFSSMKTGLALLGIVAIVSGIGTLIPQEALDPEGAQTVSSFWKAMGFTNLYASVWFQLLVGLLCINLVVCSVHRFGGIYKLTFNPNAPKTSGNVPSKIQDKVSGSDGETLKQGVQEVLKGKGFRVVSTEQDGKWSFIAQKRRWGNWGSFITHVAFIVLILGALIGSLTGFKGYLMAGEGDTVPIRSIDVSKGKVSENFSVKINSVEDRILENGERDNWYSDLSILDAGKEVARQTISVNHPLSYKGVTFYQSSYAPGAMFTVDFKGQKIPVMKTDPKEPVILYQVFKGNGQQPIKMGQLTPGQSENIQNTYTLTFDKTSGFTGLQVKKDPGVFIVWLGCGLLMLGLLLSFYWRPITFMGIIENQKEYVLTLGALSGKLSLGIKDEFERIVGELKGKQNAKE
ncbi:MAG: ResB protein required for cytochrome c biosynthesis [Firmicutes bacterium]|nr:ResB protein required for cytochrome c biosynthesis [Bacillota bacterium]